MRKTGACHGDPGQEETAMTERTKCLDTREAAVHLGLSTRTLDRYRVSGRCS